MNVQIKKTITLLVIFMMVFTPIVQAMDIIIEDPKPDTTAPTLFAVEINEAIVTPTQSQKFRIETTDDLSGVKTVTAVFIHDSGVSKYVYLQKKEGDFFEGLFSVDRYEKAGNWKLNTVELTDNKNNRTTYYSTDSSYSKTFDFSKNVFVVSGTEIRPPVVRPDDFEAPKLSTITVNTEAGDFLVSPTMPLSVKVEATDNMLGVDRVYVSFTTPRGTSTTSYLTYKATTNSFEGSFYPNQFEELGTWKISSVYLSDGWNAKTVYNSLLYPTATEKFDMEVDSFKVINTTPDFSPPTLDGLERSLTQVSSKMAIYKLIATVNDNLSGVYSVSATYLKPDNSSFNIQFSRLSDGRYYAEIPIDQYDQLGKWTMRSMTLRDFKFNDITIYNSELNTYTSNKRDFSPYNFTVRGLISLEPVVPFGIDSNYSQIEINPGETQALTTYLNYSDGSKIDVSATKTGTIYSTSTEKLSVDENGVTTASTDLAPGEYFIDVKYGAFYKRIKVLVPGEYEKKDRLIVSPSNLSISKGATHQLGVSAEINGNLYDISGSGNGVTYINEYPQLISIDSNGLIKNLTDAVLKTKIEVRYKDLTTSIEVNLTGPPSIEKVVSSPSEIELFRGGNIQLNSRALFSDGSSENISSSLNTTYLSSLTSRVNVNGTGLLTVPIDASYGYATVTVKNGSNFSKILVKVIEDLSNVMSGIEVVGPDLIMYREDSYQFDVKGIYPTGQRDITSSADGTTYVSSVPSRVSVDAEGLLTVPAGASYGDATITVKNGTFVQKLTVTVAEDTSKVLGGMEVTGPETSLERGATHQLEVTGAYPTGQRDITSSADGTTYVSSVPSRVSVDAEGLLTVPAGASYGDATITVKNGTFVQKLTVTVAEDTSKVLGGMEVTGPETSLERGATHQLEVRGAYPTGQRDITSSADGTTYVSSVPSRVSVDAEGLLTVPAGASYGDATITVKNGTFVQKLTVTVAEDTSKVLGGMEVTGPETSLERGATHQLEVTGAYPTGQRDITSSADGTTYVSSVPSRVSVDAEGLLTVPAGASYGTVTITIKNGVVSHKITVTVSENPYNVLQELLVTDSAIFLRRGETYTLSVQGIYLLRTEDLTLGSTGTTYLSSVPSRVIVNSNGILSVPSSASIGSSVITVKNGKKYVKKTIQIIN